jgi:hypothetical protein
MQLFHLSVLLSLALIPTFLISLANAGDCWSLSPQDDANSRWSPVTALKVQPRQPTGHFFTYIGSTTIAIPKPSKRGMPGFLKKIFDKQVQMYTQTEIFTATILSKSGLRDLPHLVDLKSTLANADIVIPTRQYRIVFALKNGVHSAYWINTADKCASYSIKHVTFVGEDVVSVNVYVKI